jgi:hypothetical protein
VTEIIKIQWIGMDGMDYREVDLAEAKRLVAEACGESLSVIDKKTGFTVGEITPDIKEIIIIGLMEGG